MIPTLLVLLVLPLAVALFQRRVPLTAEGFRTNAGGNGLWVTTCGAIAGNVGIGTFLAIHAFAASSALVGAAVVLAYALGLLLCAALAPAIRRAAAGTGTVGLVDLITARHGIARGALIWVPVALIFVLRASVQLAALGLLLVSALGIDGRLATVLAGGLIALYLMLGGYRAAVGTDVAQAAVIVLGMVCAALGLAGSMREIEAAPLDLGPYRPTLLIGIALFLPWSAVLAIDNWQRITLARSTRVAQGGFVLAALICGAIYAIIALAGLHAGLGADMYTDFAALMPAGMGWIATVLFVACIMSSIDTFIMALVVSLGPRRSVAAMRGTVAALMGTTTACAVLLADALLAVIAAFNALTVLLPAAAGALFLRRGSAAGAVASIWGGIALTLILAPLAIEAAALAGFACALALYALAHVRVANTARRDAG